jgi:hypothetical protein
MEQQGLGGTYVLNRTILAIGIAMTLLGLWGIRSRWSFTPCFSYADSTFAFCCLKNHGPLANLEQSGRSTARACPDGSFESRQRLLTIGSSHKKRTARRRVGDPI